MIKKYLATLHTKPEHHKKRFSFLVAASFTLLIFTVWSSVKFGDTSSTVARVEEVEEPRNEAMSPLDGLRASLSDGWSLVKGEMDKASQGLESVDIQNSYSDIRNDALSN